MEGEASLEQNGVPLVYDGGELSGLEKAKILVMAVKIVPRRIKSGLVSLRLVSIKLRLRERQGH
jgi:hypothetical protein